MVPRTQKPKRGGSLNPTTHQSHICGKITTVKHSLLESKKLAPIRKRYFQAVKKPNRTLSMKKQQNYRPFQENRIYNVL